MALKQPLLVACIAMTLLMLISAYEQAWSAVFLLRASFFLGLLCISRPDSPLICVGICLCSIPCKRSELAVIDLQLPIGCIFRL